MNSQQQLLYSLDDISPAVDLLYKQLPGCKVITFTGSLGAGKTTLVRALLQRCGIDQVITSPTFTYLNVYSNSQGQTFYHFDCYRVPTVEAFKQAGFDEYLYQPGSWAFIEWPETIDLLLTQAVCRVQLEYADDRRKLTMHCID